MLSALASQGSKKRQIRAAALGTSLECGLNRWHLFHTLGRTSSLLCSRAQWRWPILPLLLVLSPRAPRNPLVTRGEVSVRLLESVLCTWNEPSDPCWQEKWVLDSWDGFRTEEMCKMARWGIGTPASSSVAAACRCLPLSQQSAPGSSGVGWLKFQFFPFPWSQLSSLIPENNCSPSEFETLKLEGQLAKHVCTCALCCSD